MWCNSNLEINLTSQAESGNIEHLARILARLLKKVLRHTARVAHKQVRAGRKRNVAVIE